MITLAGSGMVKLQQCVNQAERMKAGGKWNLLLGNIWGCIMDQITAKMQEMGSLVNEDVQRKLDGL